MKGACLARVALVVASGTLAVGAGAEPQNIALAGFVDNPGAEVTACHPALIGDGGPAKWRVLRAASAPGGAMIGEISAEAHDARYPLCFFDAIKPRDVEVSVDITPFAGELDRAGGIILRAKDEQNFYVLRANALEHNVRLYHVVGGVRRQFAGVERNIFSGRAQTLKLRVEADQFTAWFDGKEIFRARNRVLAGVGAIGLWTKADSVTGFSNLTVERLGD